MRVFLRKLSTPPTSSYSVQTVRQIDDGSEARNSKSISWLSTIPCLPADLAVKLLQGRLLDTDGWQVSTGEPLRIVTQG